MFRFISKLLIHFLSQPTSRYSPPSTNTPESLRLSLKKGDVLLVDGNSRISSVIRTITQSNWSHSALYVGEGKLIEADIKEGVIIVGLEKYDLIHTRICRPVGLDMKEIDEVLAYAKQQLGKTYDMKNIFDLARYLLPPLPLPTRWRQKLFVLGSGDPTKVICSTMIAQSFQHIHYPILPVSQNDQQIRYQKRHFSLFTPSDFDLSPYFQIVKPTIDKGFEYKTFRWEE